MPTHHPPHASVAPAPGLGSGRRVWQGEPVQLALADLDASFTLTEPGSRRTQPGRGRQPDANMNGSSSTPRAG
jgi:hypothetical protein